jgi:mycofactocin system glycosyltransferase
MPYEALPADFRLHFDPALRRPRPEVLIGGAPLRVLRLTPAGAAMVDRWMAGSPVGPGRGAGQLAARLVEAGAAHPAPPESGPLPSAAVIIPVRDDQAGLGRTLAALARTAPHMPVVVVDDGSRGSMPLLPDGVWMIRRPSNGGPAAARNTGWAELRTTARAPAVVVFVDADCVPEPGWLPPVLRHFADPGTAAVAPRVRSRTEAGANEPMALASYESRWSPLDMGPACGPVRPGSAISYVPSAALAVRGADFERLGGFDERLRFGEDVDLVWRLHSSGGRIRYEPAAVVGHPARSSYRLWARQRFQYGRSAAPLAARHGRAVAPLAIHPWSLLSWLLAAIGRPLPGIGIAFATTMALTRRAGGDEAVASELRRLAAMGHLRAGGAIASAVKRAWLPPALVLGMVAWTTGGRRARIGLVASTVAVLATAVPGPDRRPGARRGPIPSPPWRIAGLRLADDLAYQVGVWAGALKARSPAALLPRW